MNEQEFVSRYNCTYIESVCYSNRGESRFFSRGKDAVIIDLDICNSGNAFPYSEITEKQNKYVHTYDHVYRFLGYDDPNLSSYLEDSDYEIGSWHGLADRTEVAEASPLEMLFEKCFTEVYGMESLKYLQREYAICNRTGETYFLDYLVSCRNGEKIAVEENGIHYHHPMLIGKERYRKQLDKQNTCAMLGIRLYRFSTEDCQFEERIEDDIRLFFGNKTDLFEDCGLSAERKVFLYEHQKLTLEEIEKQRAEGVRAFLVVLPTASGKSRIIEEDIRSCAEGNPEFHALVLVPGVRVKDDWEKRAVKSLKGIDVMVSTYAWMIRNCQKYRSDYFDYIVVDEAHHAVAPVLKRTIQYFDPSFLIGLTATDERPDKKKLETVFGNYNTGLSLREAMDRGIVSRANVFRIETNIDLSHIRFNGRDYVNADLEKTISVESRNEVISDVLKEYFSDGKCQNWQGVVFCVNTKHAAHMAKVLNERGISASAYTRETRQPEKVMQNFQNHKIRFLCACNMISEGWDYPELRILVMARPTLSKVLYLQQIGRGLRKTAYKKNVFVIDVVDEYGAAVKACNMHAIFENPCYVPFGDITRTYMVGDMIQVDGLAEKVLRIERVDIHSFAETYGSYLSKEQLAREYYVGTDTVSDWIRKKRITPTVVFPFGNRSIALFSREDTEKYRKELGLSVHNDQTVKQDFFSFLEERDYSMSYKMPFLLSFLRNMDHSGDADIDAVLEDYIDFYQDRIERGLPVDHSSCPYNAETLKNRKMIRTNMLINPFEKFERKRFMYYSKDLKMISLNHALYEKMTPEDWNRVRKQMKEDLEIYYSKLS